MTADGTMALLAATTTTAAAAAMVATVAATAVEEGSGGGGVGSAGMDVSGVVSWSSQENCKSHLAVSPNCEAPCF